MYKEGEKSGGL